MTQNTKQKKKLCKKMGKHRHTYGSRLFFSFAVCLCVFPRVPCAIYGLQIVCAPITSLNCVSMFSCASCHHFGSFSSLHIPSKIIRTHFSELAAHIHTKVTRNLFFIFNTIAVVRALQHQMCAWRYCCCRSAYMWNERKDFNLIVFYDSLVYDKQRLLPHAVAIKSDFFLFSSYFCCDGLFA